jgi:hypothetical protein
MIFGREKKGMKQQAGRQSKYKKKNTHTRTNERREKKMINPVR